VETRLAKVDDRPPNVDEARAAVERADHNMLRLDRASDHNILWFQA